MSDNIQSVSEELDINEIIAIRHKKLNELKEQGKDPFEIVKYVKTHDTIDIF